MQASPTLTVPEDLWPVADFFFRGLGPEINLNNAGEAASLFQSFFWLYLTTVILTVITFKLGFAKKLPLLKNVVVYTVLVIGTFLLTLMLGLNLPLAESLIVTAVVLGLYRLRLSRERNGKQA
ncbi:hypothetical protein AAV35_007640 [Salimicrobium jeotgali]|uniref:YlaH-like protein n=1 Tax=Salimicrobium jeotgali TaxID=1230341 RepID=K2G9Q5_9BACI|nr:YlaH-like family protein [Salimicrobium jeotgali]AKG04683.1 hypothetical protein AAV35_007640 [Salimicrobium jeotgali]EKE31818.1 hypothetical protein MJ3_06753 [Salimicrobium jeotgali]MBM7696219.1 hypothetical protein [Salimicrobium jeotgali]